MNYYNEHDPKAAAWLRELIACGHIPVGDVDERDIQQVKHDELTNYTQCHFFAGIGGWPLALKLAGWPDTQKVWTGSCPCQPLSCAGQGKGHADERHLWPTFHTLISECKPSVVFGEQVASKLGCEWLAGVRADLEGIGYAVGAADLAAGGIGAPHRRQRLFWVADSAGGQREQCLRPQGNRIQRSADDCNGGMAYTGSRGSKARISEQEQREEGNPEKPHDGCAGSGGTVGNSTGERRWRIEEHGGEQGTQGIFAGRSGARGFWDGAEIIKCRDGKTRRIEPSVQPLAHGIPGRVALLRGAGNAIVPEAGAEFVMAWRDIYFPNAES